MTGRKIGVGFNHLRVLRRDDYEPQNWRQLYDLMRRMTRLPRGPRRRPWHQAPIAASVVEMMRRFRRDA